MQQIERYGIIALLLIVVTIVVVALWAPDNAGSGPKSGIVAAASKVPSGTSQAVAKPKGTAASRSASSPRPASTVARRQSSFADRAAAPAMGPNSSRSLPVATQGSAPLDLGATPESRRRGRSAYSPGQAASSSHASQVVANPPVRQASQPSALAKASRLTREPVRNNSGARRSTQRSGQATLTQADRAPAIAASPKQNRSASKQQALVQTSTQRLGSSGASTPKRGYTVRSGDSLERIARRELGDGARWRELAKLNGITNPNLVRIGQVLDLPKGGKVSAAAPSKKSASKAKSPKASKRSSAATAASGTEYVVAKGDVLSRIAERQLGSSKRWREIIQLNPGLKPAKLHVGMRLVLPGSERQVPILKSRTQGAKVAQAGPAPSQAKPRYVVQ